MTISDAIKKNDVKALKAALAAGADPNALLTDGISPLAAAAAKGAKAMVDVLIEAGADPNNAEGEHLALVAAAAAGHLDVVQRLLRAKAKINQKRIALGDSDTALIAATRGGHLDVVKFLVDTGAGVTNRSLGGDSPALLAAKAGRRDMLEVLLPHATGAEKREVPNILKRLKQQVPEQAVKQFLAAGRAGDVVTLRRMLAGGIPIDVIDASGRTALIEAARFNRLEATKFLIGQGADPHIEDNYGESAVINATNSDEPDTFNFLYPLATAKEKRAAFKVIKLRQMLYEQYPKWHGWKGPPK